MPLLVLGWDRAAVLLGVLLPRDQLLVDEAAGAVLDGTVFGATAGTWSWAGGYGAHGSDRQSASAANASATICLRSNSSGMSERWWPATIVTSRAGHVNTVVPQ